ncbi:hypothetical protein CC1G_08570 [Coprinopsis cinerea okayama7|uniref:UDP-glucose:glycoprotein glucosyltransferase n=1 Tax=Coprinopsis cinerea (strain Okayama-7 / 130 / ATCC MYA-4618 / FGSC 9003) TaxID=240176 RepID=A8NCT1_COPC7|nr:hypothetical protein CC1G_08570 [Coprinopsis cinerea okayama7\|eukprot:XP_001832620.2 hypothetical protein CC1G_08570 [Coprinopsis cinerea okayama7\
MKRGLQLLLAAAALSLSAADEIPQVEISLKTSWPAPPLMHEILESIALENPYEYFTFLDALTDPTAVPKNTELNPEDIYKAAIELGISRGFNLATGWIANLKANLALHSTSPKIEAFYNYYTNYVNNTKGNECGSWVDWYGEVVCDVDTLTRLTAKDPIGDGKYPRPQSLSFDHIYPPPDRVAEKPPRTAILYAQFASPNFRALHSHLYDLARQEDARVEYVLRYVPPPPSDKPREPNVLSGYGVALDLKKMDYLALDDRFQQENSVAQHNGWGRPYDPVLDLIEAHPEKPDAPNATVPLTEEELAGLGAQAIQVISEGYAPMEIFQQLAEDFPKYATSLARRVVANESIVEELKENSVKAKGGVNMFWLNGALVENYDVEALPLLRMLRKERDLMLSLTRLGLSREQAFDVLTHPIISAAHRDTSDALFDASDRQEGGDVVFYFNDIEKDSRYSNWAPSLHELIRPMYPGQFPNIKANLFNVILALDLSQVTSLNFIAGPVSNIIERGMPFRFAVAPIIETEDGKKMARLFYYATKTFGKKKTVELLRNGAVHDLQPDDPIPPVRWSAIEEGFNQIASALETEDPEKKILPFKQVLEGKAMAEGLEDKIQAYHKRLDTTLATGPTGHAFFNGKHIVFDQTFLKHLREGGMEQQQFLMEQVYRGVLKDDILKEKGMGDYWYDLPKTNKRRNRYIFPTSHKDLKVVNLPDALHTKAEMSFGAESFVYPKNAQIQTPIFTTFIVGDFESEAGLALAREALKLVESEKSQSRITFVPNPAEWAAVKDESANALVSKLVTKKALKAASPSIVAKALNVDISSPVSSGDDKQVPLSSKVAITQLLGSEPGEVDKKEVRRYLKRSRIFAREAGVKPGETAIIINGRVIGPIPVNDFSVSDFEALEEYEAVKRTGPVLGALNAVAGSLNEDKDKFADAIYLASSIISWTQIPDPSQAGLFDAPPRPRTRNYEQLNDTYTSFEFGDREYALYYLTFLVDPLSPTGQKWAGIMRWLSMSANVYIKVYLNPDTYKEMPVKRFYRSCLEPQILFNFWSREDPAKVQFKGLPTDPIYTLSMDVPASWLVRPKESRYDLDNIQLTQLFPEDKSLKAVFSLDALILEGHARETATQTPPRGVQLQVVASDPSKEEKAVPVQDTLVVANLGYFQFRLNPGVYGLEIREGNGRKIYDMESVGGLGWDSPGVDEVGNQVALTDFEGVTLFPRLKRKPGMEKVDVLEEDKASSGVLENISTKVKSIFKGKETGVVPVKEQAEINIFTVASGLLYERFASIMILSVLKNTKSTVKFWFIENFLSPSFLEFIPHFAKEYNFDYELVTYRWPSWLRAQTEKQRIIWAYKILFLDVLFPMDLKKVIFVDADQIVRADLKELVDLDLQGAPYGYTPMGDDNKEMEGFRFWKTGYWKDFLQGKPYHISALYVIDLVRFRHDILRGQYQALSADPGSLANLDQDLPNNLQRQVPIFSLDEDWLWCETWCSKDRLHRAKTIDLCQNPLTKEPKLSRARQIPEWEEYDAEIARFTRRLAEEGKISSGLSTADANVLAGASNTEPEEVAKPEEVKPETKEESSPVPETKEEPAVPEKKEEPKETVEEEAAPSSATSVEAEAARPTDEL